MPAFDIEIGRTISHFRMEKKLGEGGMGAVYLAEDLTLSRRVAIKFMSRSLLIHQGNEAVRESLEKRFVREAKSAAAINHPNLAQIYEANFDSEDWYIAMEFIDGKSLYDLLVEDKKVFTIDEIVSVCRQVVSGLDYAWQNYTIIHRDIKPHNIMLTKTNLVKIVDLGLAKPVASDDTQMDMPDLTGAGTPIGTPQYMAPEQATGQKDINYLADIFALGATLYEICCGKKAFSGATAPMIYMSQVQKKYTPLRELRTDVPPALESLIDNLLEPKIEDRIDSYQAILDALHGVPLSGGAAGHGGGEKQQTFSSTVVGQMSSKTMGVDGATMYHAADQLIKNRYRILKTIGKSRTGIEYHCLDTQLSVECSVKSIFPGREFPASEMPRIKENFQRLMGYSHPNLVQIRDLTQDDETGEFFVVMETLPGHNLRDYTHRLKNAIDVIDVRAIEAVLTLIGRAVDNVAKTFGITDHDLTPENIYLIKNDSQVKLMDFGITIPSPDDMRQVKPQDHFKFPLATPDYMAPELWQRKTTNRQADQYSFGVIVYEMLAAKLPFWLKDPIPEEQMTEELRKLSEKERQLKHLYDRVLNDPPLPLPFLKRHENAALGRALAKEPQIRFGSCEEFAKAITKAGAMTNPGAMAAAGIAAALVLGTIVAIAVRKGDRQDSAIAGSVAQRPATMAARQTPTGPSGVATENVRHSDAGAGAASKEFAAGVMEQAVQQANAAAALEQEAAHKARMMEMKVEATGLQETFVTARQTLAAHPFATDLLPQVDAIRTEAEKNFAAGAFDRAVTQYKQATALVNNLMKQAEEKRATQLLKVKNEALSQKKSFTALRAELANDELLMAKLEPANVIAQQADGLLKDEKFPEALREFKRAIDRAQDVVNQRNQELKAKAESLQTEAQSWRDKLDKYKGLSSELTEEIVKVDVTLSLARTELNKEEFKFSTEQFTKAVADCKAILETAETKFKATLGRDFTEPKAGVDFVWIEALKCWSSKYEITNDQYRRYKPSHNSRKDGKSGLSMNGDRQPVVWLSYYDAVGFCQWLNAVSARDSGVPDGYTFRLPSRDEWIALARCGVDRLYPWGNDWPPKYGNYGNQELFPTTWQLDGYEDDSVVTAPVEKSGKNEWGLFGVAGNVWEWTTDLKNDLRAVMGGGWTDVNRAVLFVNIDRAYASMTESYDNIGVRVLLAPETP